MLLLLLNVVAATGGITGGGSISDGNETVGSTAATRSTASGTVQDGGETVTSTVTARLNAVGTIQDGGETASGSATARLAALGTIADGNDTASATGNLRVAGGGAITDTADAGASVGAVGVGAVGGATDGQEAVAGAGGAVADIPTVVGIASVSDPIEQAFGGGKVLIAGQSAPIDAVESAGGIVQQQAQDDPLTVWGTKDGVRTTRWTIILPTAA